MPKSAENRTFRAFFVHFLRKKGGSPHFSAIFLESAETPLFVQINVFAVWPLRLDRKYTTAVRLSFVQQCLKRVLGVGVPGKFLQRSNSLK